MSRLQEKLKKASENFAKQGAKCENDVNLTSCRVIDTKLNREPAPKIPEAENKTSSAEKFSCPDCHSLEVWLPRVPGVDAGDPAAWRCVKCKPPPNPSLVAKRRGPSIGAIAAANATERTPSHPEAFAAVVVAEESPQCSKCLGSWVLETPTASGVDRVCYCCRTPIVAGQVVCDRLPSDGHWRNPFLLFLRERESSRNESEAKN